jgi:hypothetical protein
LLDFEEQTTEVPIPLDDFIEGLGKGLHLLSLIIGCLFKPRGQLFLEIDGIGCEITLILVDRLTLTGGRGLSL